jgi:hypothetical protein
MHATWLKKDLEDLHFNSFLYVQNSMSWGQWSNGKNDDLGGSSSTKPEGGLIQKLSEEASTVATKILMRHASDGLPRGRYWKTFQRAKYRHRERVGGWSGVATTISGKSIAEELRGRRPGFPDCAN